MISLRKSTKTKYISRIEVCSFTEIEKTLFQWIIMSFIIIRYIQTRMYHIDIWYPVHSYNLDIVYFIFSRKNGLVKISFTLYTLHIRNDLPELTLNVNGNIHLAIDINYIQVYFIIIFLLKIWNVVILLFAEQLNGLLKSCPFNFNSIWRKFQRGVFQAQWSYHLLSLYTTNTLPHLISIMRQASG